MNIFLVIINKKDHAIIFVINLCLNGYGVNQLLLRTKHVQNTLTRAQIADTNFIIFYQDDCIIRSN